MTPEDRRIWCHVAANFGANALCNKMAEKLPLVIFDTAFVYEGMVSILNLSASQDTRDAAIMMGYTVSRRHESDTPPRLSRSVWHSNNIVMIPCGAPRWVTDQEKDTFA